MFNKTEALIETLLNKTKRLEIDEADVLVIESKSLSTKARLGKLEDMEQSESIDIGLRAINKGRQLTISTKDTSKEAMINLAEQAAKMVNAVPQNNYCGLAEKHLWLTHKPNLDLVDETKLEINDLLKSSIETEESAMSVSGITNTEGASSSFSKKNIKLANSKGFNNSYSQTLFSRSVSVIAGKGTKMERDYEFQSATHIEDIDKPEKIGLIAGERAIARLNPKKIKSNTVPIIFDKRVSGSLLSILAGSISGQSIARGTSFLKNKIGKSVFNSDIFIYDDPLRARGHRSKAFDTEGVKTKKIKIISKGILSSWLLDCSTARQLNLNTTGHASRSTNSPPSPTPSNMFLKAGNISRTKLIKSIKQGLYVTEMMGMSFNQVTGDYSRGASGFWIDNGELTFPVSEVTIAGNILDVFKHLIPASDLELRTGIDSPTVMIEKMTVAGL